MMKTLFSGSVLSAAALLVISTLAGCAGTQTITKPLPAVRDAKLSLVYQSNRFGWLEPCGCESKPFGGIDREANALDGMKKEGTSFLYVDAGNLFAPKGEERRAAHYREKAKTITAMLGRMGLEVFAPGPTDYALGTAFLKEIAKDAKFTFISTNVLSEGKPVFTPYRIVEKKGVRIAFLSLTPATGIEDKTLTVESPDRALDRWLPEAAAKSDFVVLLSQLGTSGDEVLAPKYPQVQVIVGGDTEFSFEEPLWFQGRTILVDPHINGFLLGRLDMDLKFPFQGLYSESAIAANKAKLATWEAKLKKDASNKLAAQYVAKIRAEDNIAPIEGGSSYRNALVELDAKRFGAKNGISKMLADEKERVRNRAIKGE